MDENAPTAAAGGASIAEIRKVLKANGFPVGSRGPLTVEALDAFAAIQSTKTGN